MKKYISIQKFCKIIQNHFNYSDEPVVWISPNPSPKSIEIRLFSDDPREVCSYCGEEIELFFRNFTSRIDWDEKIHYFHKTGKCHPSAILKNDRQWWRKHSFYMVSSDFDYLDRERVSSIVNKKTYYY